jgi:hypothetical protein
MADTTERNHAVHSAPIAGPSAEQLRKPFELSFRTLAQIANEQQQQIEANKESLLQVQWRKP